jgi:hypothetical protein
LVGCRPDTQAVAERGKALKEDEMKVAAGSRIIVEAEKVAQSARAGVIEEVLRSEPPRYRVRWDDGHTSIITPAAGAARIEPKLAKRA